VTCHFGFAGCRNCPSHAVQWQCQLMIASAAVKTGNTGLSLHHLRQFAAEHPGCCSMFICSTSEWRNLGMVQPSHNYGWEVTIENCSRHCTLPVWCLPFSGPGGNLWAEARVDRSTCGQKHVWTVVLHWLAQAALCVCIPQCSHGFSTVIQRGSLPGVCRTVGLCAPYGAGS